MLDPDVVGAVVAIAGGLLALLRLHLLPRADASERRRLGRSGAIVGALALLWAVRDLAGLLLPSATERGVTPPPVDVACAGACAALGLVLLAAPWLGARADGRAYRAALGVMAVTAMSLGVARLNA